MKKKQVEEQQKRENGYYLKIIFSVIIMAISFLAELYTMIVLQGEWLFIGIFGLIFVLSIYGLVSNLLNLLSIRAKLEKDDHESLLRSEKASYLIVKKSFEEIFARLESFEKSINIPTEELITAQKAIAKVNINRSKENTDALMNSNDLLLGKVLEFEDILSENNQKLLDSQNENLEKQIKDIILKQQELSSTVRELELSLKNDILQAVNSVAVGNMGNVAPMPMMQDPMSFDEEPMMLDEEPMMLDEEPMILDEEPMTLDEEPMMLDEEPMTLDEEPMMLDEEPMSLDDDLMSFGEELIPEQKIDESAWDDPIMAEPMPEQKIDESAWDDPIMAEPMPEQKIDESAWDDPIMAEPMPEAEVEPEPAPATMPEIDLSDPNKQMTPEEIAALFSNVGAEVLDESPVEEPQEEEVQIPQFDMSDPNKMMSPEDIAALIENL